MSLPRSRRDLSFDVLSFSFSVSLCCRARSSSRENKFEKVIIQGDISWKLRYATRTAYIAPRSNRPPYGYATKKKHRALENGATGEVLTSTAVVRRFPSTPLPFPAAAAAAAAAPGGSSSSSSSLLLSSLLPAPASPFGVGFSLLFFFVYFGQIQSIHISNQLCGIVVVAVVISEQFSTLYSTELLKNEPSRI